MSERFVPSWKYPAAVGGVLIFLTFVVFGGWAAIAPLDSTANAPGVVIMQSNRQTVQHFEGGIIKKILIREGEKVEAGQVLFKLDTTQAKANYDLQRQQLDATIALEARLMAERDGLKEINFPAELVDRDNQQQLEKIISDQKKQFQERRTSLEGQTGILESRMEQFKTEIGGLKEEREATQSQLKYIEQELTDLRGLLDRGLVQKSRVLQLEREKSRLEGIIGRSTADMAKAENGIGEARLQIGQLHQKFSEEVSASSTEARQKLGDLREKVRVAADVLSRSDIIAPLGGVVQNLKIFTVGGVIRGGEALCEIAPSSSEMLVQAYISPMDIERVSVGMKAEVRFPSFKQNDLPIISGTVLSLSRDRLMNEATHQPYYLAQVTVDYSTLPRDVREKLTAGMPADVVLPTGERTALAYLLEPLKDRVRGAMHER